MSNLAKATMEICNGTIRRIAPNDLVYVELDLPLAQKSVSFAPNIVYGYMGEPLREFGLRPGQRVVVKCDPSSGLVASARLTARK